MVQMKKPEIRAAILESARALFREKGYADATMSGIAHGAKTSPANIYVYFDSKLEILLSVYEPWLRDRLQDLSAKAATISEPASRVRFVLYALWREIPSGDHFARNVIQAVCSVAAERHEMAALRRWCAAELGEMLCDALPGQRRQAVEATTLGHLVLSTFEGFTMDCDGSATAERVEAAVELFTHMLLGEAHAAGPGDDPAHADQ